jgi:hypothetical protein
MPSVWLNFYFVDASKLCFAIINIRLFVSIKLISGWCVWKRQFFLFVAVVAITVYRNVFQGNKFTQLIIKSLHYLPVLVKRDTKSGTDSSKFSTNKFMLSSLTYIMFSFKFFCCVSRNWLIFHFHSLQVHPTRVSKIFIVDNIKSLAAYVNKSHEKNWLRHESYLYNFCLSSRCYFN